VLDEIENDIGVSREPEFIPRRVQHHHSLSVSAPAGTTNNTHDDESLARLLDSTTLQDTATLDQTEIIPTHSGLQDDPQWMRVMAEITRDVVEQRGEFKPWYH
jgi:hypothetical protein